MSWKKMNEKSQNYLNNPNAILMAHKHTSLYNNMKKIKNEIINKKRKIDDNNKEIVRLQSILHPSFSLSKSEDDYLDKQYNFLIQKNHELVAKKKAIEIKIRDNKFTIDQIKFNGDI